MDKYLQVLDLINSFDLISPLRKYFDFDSEKMLDKKIEVLSQLKEGKSIDEIEGGYEIFELLDMSQHWD